ncbi:uncharacterized protein LOC111269247 isoform X2 [Varroa jacobsoni]|uniref:uncharacterized protein LOC111269247 isoform X2 n=1 Tax=Varroa jacobsoni TaxID=62625 RepID=UPI000BF894D2|nr:uncharacterized protein LOC111269247 isoform X2 [Varroa jacobsoni]
MLAMAQHINFFAVQVAAQSATFLEFYVHTKQFQMKPRYKDYCSVRWNTTRETCYIQSRPTCSHSVRAYDPIYLREQLVAPSGGRHCH